MSKSKLHPDDWNDLQKKIDEAGNIGVRISKDEYYLGIAKAVSKRSTCLKRHYGCIIVNNDEIIATGYNGSPRGQKNCCDEGKCERLSIPHNSGDYSTCPAVHSEQNAMLSAARKDMIGSTMYIYGEEEIQTSKSLSMVVEIADAEPCPICKRMLLNAGVAKIINKEGEVCLL